MATALLAAAALAAGAPAPDSPGIVLQRVAAPTHVAARDGVAVFGAFDPATGTTTLMRRLRGGSIAPAGVPPIPAPAFAGDRRGRRPGDPPAFEVTLGTGLGGGLVAAEVQRPRDHRRHLRSRALPVRHQPLPGQRVRRVRPAHGGRDVPGARLRPGRPAPAAALNGPARQSSTNRSACSSASEPP